MLLLFLLLAPAVTAALDTLLCQSHGKVNLCSSSVDLTRVEVGIHFSNPDVHPCVKDVTFGIQDSRSIWVDKFCWAQFVLNRKDNTLLHMAQCAESVVQSGTCEFRSKVLDAKLMYQWWGYCKDNGSFTIEKTSLKTQKACNGHFAVTTFGSEGPSDFTEDRIVSCDSVNKMGANCSAGGQILRVQVLTKRAGLCAPENDLTVHKDVISVRDYCKADFLVTISKNNTTDYVQKNRFLSCASTYNRLTFCRADTQIEDAQLHEKYIGNCVRGLSYGWYGNILWTRHDCRAKFLLNRGVTHTCSSTSSKLRTVCARGVKVTRVDLLHTVSNFRTQACIEGKTYGAPAFDDGTGFWVSGLCKGEFWINKAANTELETVNCRSPHPETHMYTLCFLAGKAQRASVLVDRSVQRCGLDHTFKLLNNQLLVSGHCDATFVVEVAKDLDRQLNNIELTCTSTGFYTECESGTKINKIKLARTLSGTCREGVTFGHRASKIWVNSLCAGKFVINEF